MEQHRVIVIGGGIAGASTAFALARRGADVTVVDSALPGQATAAGAGIISPWASSVEGEVRRLGNDEVRALVPVLARDLEGVFISGGGRVDGRTMRDALLAGAAHHGARPVPGRARLLPRPHGAPAVETDAGVLEADDVVIASGAWVNDLLEPFGVRLAVEPQRGQITLLRLDGVDTGGWPSVHPLSHHYLVAFDDSRVVVGATRETGSGFDARVTARGQWQVLSDALGMAPGLAGATLIETRVGLRPLPGGELPIVGALPGAAGLHVVTGFGAAGLTMAPLTGDALARSILERETPPEISAFAP
ncbi:FAD-dependent oxidoreductase [Nonomuraea sp. NPDC050643]|uniref:NAD(P)/FAD-dependent oxidoreductase n=1 Tax=Nonomuraea sp. NPDC050643 TaxID=3155660 RepID=UPI0033E5CFCF